MSDNPYQAPAEEPPSEKSASVEERAEKPVDLKAVVRHQKGVVAVFGVYLLFLVGPFVSTPAARPFTLFTLVVLGMIGAVDAYPLVTLFYRRPVALLLTALTMLPGIGLFVLFLTQVKSNRFLKTNKVKAGLLGAQISELQE